MTMTEAETYTIEEGHICIASWELSRMIFGEEGSDHDQLGVDRDDFECRVQALLKEVFAAATAKREMEARVSFESSGEALVALKEDWCCDLSMTLHSMLRDLASYFGVALDEDGRLGEIACEAADVVEEKIIAEVDAGRARDVEPGGGKPDWIGFRLVQAPTA